MSTKDLGLVTAYGYAKEGGFTGTESEFKSLLGNVAEDLAEIESISATATTLDPGSSATASYNSGEISLGIPEGLPGRGIVSVEETAVDEAVHTYTMTFTDDTTFEYDVTDGEVTDASLATVLEDYAKIDGYYQDMSVGDAEQLITDVKANDKSPYLYRPAGGSVDIGDREYINGIVGVSLPWNQLIKDGNFPNTNSWAAGDHGTLSVSNGVIKSEATENGNIYVMPYNVSIGIYNDHKYLVSVDVRSSGKSVLLSTAFQGAEPSTSSTSFVTLSAVKKRPSDYTGAYPRLIMSSAETGDWFEAKNFVMFDLTLMFGSAIADYVYTLESGTAGAGIAWLKKYGYFTKPYYPYTASSMKSVSGLVSHDTIGFNQFDKSTATVVNDKARDDSGQEISSSGVAYTSSVTKVLGNTQYTLSGLPASPNLSFRIYFLDADNGWISRTNAVNFASQPYTFTTPANCAGLQFQLGKANTSFDECCLNLHWDGSRDGEYEHFVKHSYPLDDSVTLRGKPMLDANNNLVYDGDVYYPNGEGETNYSDELALGGLEWARNSTYGFFYAYVNDFKDNANGSTNKIPKAVCSAYVASTLADVYDSGNGVFTFGTSNNFAGRILFKDSAYSDAATFKQHLTDVGAKLVYELATPTTFTADPYQATQIVDDFGTEGFVFDDDVFEVPPCADADFPINLRSKLEMAPNSPSQGDGDYVVRQTSGINEYVLLEHQLPSAPTEDGSYLLKCTVSSGTATLTWESEE